MGDARKEVDEALQQLATSPQMDSIKEFIDKVMANSYGAGLPLLEAMGMNASSLEGYYNKAFQLCKSGKFVEAKKILKVMVMLCPTDHKIAFALAACHHRTGDISQALAAYQMSTMSDPTDPLPYYHAADCLIQMGIPAAAAESLRIAIENCGENPVYAVIKDRATMAFKKLEAAGGVLPPMTDEVSPGGTDEIPLELH